MKIETARGALLFLASMFMLLYGCSGVKYKTPCTIDSINITIVSNPQEVKQMCSKLGL